MPDEKNMFNILVKGLVGTLMNGWVYGWLVLLLLATATAPSRTDSL